MAVSHRPTPLAVLAGLALSVSVAGAAEANPDGIAPLEDFIGCWRSAEPAGTVVREDGFREDAYKLTEETVLLSIRPISEDPAYQALITGKLDIWSSSEGYYIPTIYYEAVYDPVRGALISDSIFYLVDGRLIFVHHRNVETSDRALRYLNRVDCADNDAKRAEIQSTYRNLIESDDASSLGVDAPERSNP